MKESINKDKKLITTITIRILSRFAISFAAFAVISVLLSGLLYLHIEFVDPANIDSLYHQTEVLNWLLNYDFGKEI